VYLETDGKYDYADANASATTAAVIGITLNGAADGQPLIILTEGDLENGSGMTTGVHYVLADTAGTGVLMPVADQAASDWVTYIGTAISATVLRVKINVTGIQQ
jgi:hypothetical protein